MTPSLGELERILLPAVRAPSGDNCQPWRYRWDGAVLEVIHVSSRAKHALNKQWVASFLSLGMVQRSLELSAAREGWEARFELEEALPDDGIWARVGFRWKAGVMAPAHAQFLESRFTDRRPFLGGTADEVGACASVVEGCLDEGVRFHCLSPEPALISLIARFEAIVPQVKRYCDDLMEWIRFNPHSGTVDGMPWQNLGIDYVSTRTLKGFQGLGWLSYVMRYGGALGLRASARRNLRSSAALGLICCRGTDAKDLVGGGKAAFESWLWLASRGFSLQPLSALPLLTLFHSHGRIETEVATRFGALFEEGASQVRAAFGLGPSEIPIWMFRAGKGRLPLPPPTPRLPLAQILLVDERPVVRAA